MTELAIGLIWKNNATSFPTKIKLYKSLVLSILMHRCDRWTLTADLERRIQAFKNKRNRKMVGILYIEHQTNEYVWQQVNILAEPRKLSLSTVKRRMLPWFGHVCRHDTLRRLRYVEHRMVVVAEEDLVNHGRTTSINGQTGRCGRCCASRMTVYCRKHCLKCRLQWLRMEFLESGLTE